MSQIDVVNQLLVAVEKMNLQELMNNALNEPDPNKKQVLHALYTYALDKKTR